MNSDDSIGRLSVLVVAAVAVIGISSSFPLPYALLFVAAKFGFKGTWTLKLADVNGQNSIEVLRRRSNYSHLFLAKSAQWLIHLLLLLLSLLLLSFVFQAVRYWSVSSWTAHDSLVLVCEDVI